MALRRGIHQRGFVFPTEAPKLPKLVIEVLSNQEIAKLVDCINPNPFYFGRVFRAKQLPTLSCMCQSSLNYGIICD